MSSVNVGKPAGRPDTARPANGGAGYVAVRVTMAGGISVTGESDLDDPWLSAKQCGELTGMTGPAWRSLVWEGYAPKPDDPGDLDLHPKRRNPKWRRSTVARYLAKARPRRPRKPKPEVQ